MLGSLILYQTKQCHQFSKNTPGGTIAHGKVTAWKGSDGAVGAPVGTLGLGKGQQCLG